MAYRFISTWVVSAAIVGLAGCGPASNAKPPEKPVTNQEVLQDIEASMQKGLQEIDADTSLSASEKEARKAMVRKTVEERSKSFRQ